MKSVGFIETFVCTDQNTRCHRSETTEQSQLHQLVVSVCKLGLCYVGCQIVQNVALRKEVSVTFSEFHV